MIYVLAGDIGSGKTLTALDLMRSACAAGRPVFTDIQLLDACPFADQVCQIGTPDFPVACEFPEPGQRYRFFWEYAHKVRGALIVLDEADIEFDSSDYVWFGRNCKIYNKQVRKFKHDVVYIVQRVSNLYKRIRDLAGRFILCEHTYKTIRFMRQIERWFGRDVALWSSRFLKAEFADQNFTPRHYRGGGFFSYTEATPMFGWYDTEQLLGASQRIIEGTAVHAHDLPRNNSQASRRSRAGGRDGQRGDVAAPLAAAPEALSVLGHADRDRILRLNDAALSIRPGSGDAEIDAFLVSAGTAFSAIDPGRAQVVENVFSGGLEERGGPAIIVG